MGYKRYFPITVIASFFFTMVLSCHQEPSAPPVVSIIPKPVSLQRDSGIFNLNSTTTIVLADSELTNCADFLNAYLDQYYGFRLKVKTKPNTSAEQSGNTIILTYKKINYPFPGAYSLVSNKKQVQIAGDNAPGVFYGIQTLIQLLPVKPAHSLIIAAVRIEDYPRFKYRGMMLDCGRHFFDIAFIKKFIDFIAMHKMNTFHWHLTEDQGWRIQIKKYPKLTEIGAWRDSTIIGHPGDKPEKYDTSRSGGFYTQDEIKDIVQYAKERYITVIPEIEMPGHSMAAIAAYPELACQQSSYHVGTTWGVYDTILCPTPYTFNFYENVLKEVMDLFPSHYIHIGGDEAPKVTWDNSQFCKQLMKELHLKNSDELQSYFISRMEKYLNDNGRDIIGWDEILQGGLAPNATVMSWRGEEGGIAAAKMHHNVIMTPTTYLYLDYYQSNIHDSLLIGGYLPLEKVYSYDPIAKELDSTEAHYIEGVQGNLWTEYIKWPSTAEYQLFPRMEAVAEIAWTPQRERNYQDFEDRVITQFKRYDLWKVSYSKAIFEIDTKPQQRSDFNGINLQITSTYKGGSIYYTTDGDEPTVKDSIGNGPVHITKSGVLRTALFIEGKKVGPETSLKLAVNKATGKAITLAQAPSDQYNAGGAFTLVDGISPQEVNGSPGWLGWSGGSMDAIIDLGKKTSITKVSVCIGNAPGSWIYSPKKIVLSASDDGKNFRRIKEVTVQKDMGTGAHTIELDAPDAAGRYFSVKAENFGTIPTGNPGAGSQSWLFIGEIGIE